MTAFKLAFRNLIGAGLRTWLNVGVLAFILILIIMSQGGTMAWISFFVALGAIALAYVPLIPLPTRFFPLSAISGIAGAMAPFFGG